MIYIQTHFNLNRILMLAVGLWPYQRSKFIEFQMILFFGILTSFVIFQLTTLLTTECTPDFIIKVLSSSLYFSTLVIIYSAFWINIQSVKRLLERLQNIYTDITDDGEIAIIQRYGNNAKRFTFIIISSRSRSAMQVVTEYFIDQEKYFYLILLHMNVTIYIGATAVIATGTMLMGYLKHICGMFSIARYRIEQAMKFDTLQNTGLEDENVIYKKLIYAVDIHRKAIEFSEFLISSFEGSLFLLIGVGVSCVTLSLYGVISHKSDVAELLFHFTGTTCTLVCIFVVNYAAQNVTDHNNDVFTTVYNVKWYMAPLNIQKMMLFLLQRGTKVFNLNIGGVFVASLESAATLTSLSISYFTVLYSTRK
ncbi:uncharacterized protein LOC105285851 isoform X2 [Ooceraea biroi]|uniref:uncharacterized protein LOC105285851 isoform X2 n=1 Tax=Ooceraea biroi TaxID=2015173 RepID=UPI000F083E24|nr:uncharacterized protein LOC105285851 isoform X2 [Ooceraea biroi]